MPRFDSLGASSRLRLLQYYSYISQQVDVADSVLISDEMLRSKYRAGKYSIAALISSYTNRISQIVRFEGDLIWIEKEALPWFPAFFELLLYSRVPFVLDFDDATFHTYDLHRSPWIRKLMGKKIDILMSRSALVIAGNNYLASRARSAGARNVVVAPTVVDLERYQQRTNLPISKPTRIVWIGSPSTAQYLASLALPLAQLARECNFLLRVIGAQPVPMPGVELEVLPWSADTEAELLRECDVGVMPLFDTPWERGKCAYKLIQYMACGLPTVASAVGANNEVTIDGETGFLVGSDSQWIERLRQLLQDANLRQRLGTAGRHRVEEHYSLQVMAPQMCGWLQRAAEGAPCAA